MPTKTQPKPSSVPKPAGRTQWLKLRVSPEEKAVIEAQSKAAGLGISEYLRHRAGIGKFGRADLMRGPSEARTVMPPESAPKLRPRFEQRVREEMRTMPRGNAERLVRREEARERAKAALTG